MKNFMMIMARKISAVLILPLVVFQLAISPVALADKVTEYGNWRLVQETDGMDGTVTKYIMTESKNRLSGWDGSSGLISVIIPCEASDFKGVPMRRISFYFGLRFEPETSILGIGYEQATRIRFDDGQAFEADFAVSKTFRVLGGALVKVQKRKLKTDNLNIQLHKENDVVIIDELKKSQKLKLEVEIFNTEREQIADFDVAGLSEVLPHCDK